MEMFNCLNHLCDEGYVSSGDEVDDKDAAHLSHVGLAAYEVLRSKHNRSHKSQWNVTHGKVVGALDQTPQDGWTRTKEYPSVHDEWFPIKMGEIMSRTQKWCDLLSLSPPDGLFLDKIIEALHTVAKNSIGKEEPVVIRMMFGNIVGMPLNANKLIKILTKDLPAEANLHLWVGAWRRGASWNHAKIIAVDGIHLHTGGHVSTCISSRSRVACSIVTFLSLTCSLTPSLTHPLTHPHLDSLTPVEHVGQTLFVR